VQGGFAEMLAVMLIISVVSAALAVGVAHMVALPFWTLMLMYPLGGMFGLLATAAFVNFDLASKRQSGRFAAVRVIATRQPPQH
jgi:hypothetical protein